MAEDTNGSRGVAGSASARHPEELFEKFKEDCSHCPIQYTPEWFARVDSIGGSEMDDLIHHPYILAAKKIRTLVSAMRPKSTTPPILPAQMTQEGRDRAKKTHARDSPGIHHDATDSMDGIEFLAAPKERKPRRNVAGASRATIDSMDDVEFIGAGQSSTARSAPSLRDPSGTPCADAEPSIKVMSMTAGVLMGWGTLFEPELCNYIARKLAIPIECRSVSYFNTPWRFSPDGVFRDASGRYALLEMKNPYVRVWSGWDETHNDQFIAPDVASNSTMSATDGVPPRYIPQLQMGLHLFPFLSYAFYVEAIYRRAGDRGPCAVGFQKMNGMRNAQVLDAGIIGFYQTSGTGDPDTAFDFGTSKNDLVLCHVLAHQRDGDDSFIPMYFVDQDLNEVQQCCHVFKNVSELPREYNGKPLFGYMPWNLIGIHSAVLQRNTSFLTDTMHKNANVISAFTREHMVPDETVEQKINGLRSLSASAAINGDGQSIEVERIIEEITSWRVT